MLDLVKATKVLAEYFDIEIIEKHHNQKLDAPSGTALMIADAINEVMEQKHEYVYDRHLRRQKEVRMKLAYMLCSLVALVGEHSVIFAGSDEIIELKHTAL